MIRRFTSIPFVRDLATMQVGRVLATGCSFLTSIIYARYLGIGGYGEYAVIMAFTGTAGIIANLGQQATTLTFFSEAYGQGDRKKLRIILQYYLCMSLCTVIVLGLLAYIAPMLSIALYQKQEIGQLARLVFLASMMEPIFAFVSIALQTVRDIRFLTLLENGKILLQLALASIFLWMGHGVFGVLLSSLFASACFALIGLAVYPSIARKHALPSLVQGLIGVRFSGIKLYTKEGMWIALDKNIGGLYPTVFIFCLSIVAPEAVVGLIRLGLKLGGLPASFVLTSISRLASSVIPTIAGKGMKILRQQLLKLALHTALLHVSATVGALILVPIFLPYVYGPNYSVAVYPFIVVAILNTSLAMHAIITPVLRVFSKIRISALLNVIATISAIGFFFLLSDITRPTLALYGALTLYHIIIGLIIFPALRSVTTRP